jgi:hypothetical protein
MNEEIRRVLAGGLHADNLRELNRLCLEHFDESPTVYGSLITIFDSIINEYDGQAITVERARAVDAALLRPIELLLNADSRNPDSVLSRLDVVSRTFNSLKK